MSPALASGSLTTGPSGKPLISSYAGSLAATQLAGEKHKDKYPLTGLLITETAHQKLPVIYSKQMTALYKNHSPLNIKGRKFSSFLCTKLLQSYLTLFNPKDCSLKGSSVRVILQAKILEWVAMSFSRGSS